MPWSSYSEAREFAALAKQVRLLCPHCQGQVFVTMPHKPPQLKRQKLIREAIDEHRRVCTVAEITDGFVYSIEYPRA